METQLRYKKEASKWMEALPIGNGSLGGMVYGGVRSETVGLNEESFWAGYPCDNHRPDVLENLNKVRRCIDDGDFVKAQEIVEHKMLSRFTQPYQPLGTLHLEFENMPDIYDYERSLHMDTGMVAVNYRSRDTHYSREYFCSYPDQVMAVRIAAEGASKLDFVIGVDSPGKYETKILDSGELYMETIAPSEVLIDDVYQFPQDSQIRYGEEETIHGHLMLHVMPQGGEVITCADKIRVKGCSECILYLASTTSYKVKDGKEWCRECLKSVLKKKYAEVKERHEKDISTLFHRMSLRLNAEADDYDSEKNQNGRQDAAELLNDPGQADRVTELLFQYGRYLLISSSREGGLPANLQGIWNEKRIPAWWSNWTMNINLEMNYWPVYRCNLAECAGPLHQFIGNMAEKGRETARKHYGCGGWTAHHMMDIWMDTTPIGYNGKPEKDSASWAMWNLAGAWLCLHLWESYLYTRDLEFLREYSYPIMKGCAEFIMDWLVWDGSSYQTMPSISPENLYIDEEGNRIALCKSSAMDMEIIRELLEAVEKAGVLAGESEEFLHLLSEKRDKLAPVKTGEAGNVLEWGEEKVEEDEGHRHFSHLFSLYPGHQFTAEKKKELWNAARVSLEKRMEHGGGATGWSRAWAICLWARLGRGQEAYESVLKFQKEDVFSNFFGYCPPEYFQIDCNFGFTAAVAEMLLQTEDDVIIPLPAVPAEWRSGEVKGLVREGGNVVNIVWKNGSLECLRIRAAYTGICRIKTEGNFVVRTDTDRVPFRVQNGCIEFGQSCGEVYEIAACPE